MILRRRQSLLASGGLTLAAGIWSTLLALITVPVMVHGLGLTSYGIYSVAFSVTALGSYLDFGLGWTTAKFVAEADALTARRQIGTAVTASAVHHLVVGLVFAVAVIAWADWISVVALDVPADSVNAASAVLRITAVSFLASSLGGVFISATRGLRRFATATLIATGATTISMIGAAAAAWLGLGVVAAATAQLVGAACGLMAGVVACRGILRASERGKALWQQWRAMLNFSIWNYVTRLFQILVFQVDKIVIARWAGPAVLVFYAVPFNLAQRVNFLAAPAVTAIYPVATVGRFDREAFMRQYLSASRLLHMVTAALAIAVLVWGDRFLDAWVGAEMAAHGTFFLRVLTIGFWVVSVGSFDGGCIEGWNRPKLTCVISAVATGTGVAVAAMAIWTSIGFAQAVALGVASYFVVAGLGQMMMWYRMSRYSAAFMLRRVAVPIVEMSALAVFTSILLRSVVEGRIATIATLIGLALALTAYGLVRTFSKAELRVLCARVLAPFRTT